VTSFASDSWGRAQEAFRLAEHDLPISADGAASRAYYAAFHATSALLALEGRTFSKHSAVEAAVHRDLVKAGIWPQELGKYYTALWELRSTADYGGAEHVTKQEAEEAIRMARAILEMVAKIHPELPPLDDQ